MERIPIWYIDSSGRRHLVWVDVTAYLNLIRDGLLAPTKGTNG